MATKEVYVSVDVATSGPLVSKHSILAIGASIVGRPKNFYQLVKPISDEHDDVHMRGHGITMDFATEHGVSAQMAVTKFTSWVNSSTPHQVKVVFVANNACYDWPFVLNYLMKYASNPYTTISMPFGNVSGLDLRVLFMGHTNCSWQDANKVNMRKFFDMRQTANYHPLNQALENAEICYKLLDAMSTKEYNDLYALELLATKVNGDPTVDTFLESQGVCLSDAA